MVLVAMGGKILFDAARAGKLSYDQWANHKAFCGWCLIAAAATFAMLFYAAPEVWNAVQNIWRRK
jgi:uncharacterized membrane protein